jgi:GABA permease
MSRNVSGWDQTSGLSMSKTNSEAAMASAPSSTGLAHSLRARHVTMISLGGIIGAGLFVGSSSALAAGGPAVILTYAGIGLLVFLIMRMLGEMAVSAPGRGSFAEYSALALGDWAGFVMRWLYWYTWIFSVGAETVAAAKLMHQLGFPSPIWMTGIGLVTVMTLLNLLSVGVYGELEFWFAFLKVSAIAAFIVVGTLFIAAFGPGPHQALQNVIGHGGVMPLGLGGILAAVPIAMFSMYGSEVATIAAAESADPAANVARASRTVALRILAFYVLSIVVVIAIVPWSSLVPGLSPFKAVLDAIGIPGSSLMMSVIVITAVMSCLNSGIYITSRMLYELAKSGGAPKILARTTKKRVPALGVIISCSVGCAATLAQLYMRQDVFSVLASTSGDLMLVIYIIITVGQIRFRRKLEAEGAEVKLKMWFFPWLSYAVIAALIGVIVLLALLPQERITLALSGLPVVLVAIALGVRNRIGATKKRPAVIVTQAK